jgi:hypothetical protein
MVHDVTLVREADGMTIIVMNNVNDTQIEITDSSLEPSLNYSIHIRTKLIHGTCETGDATIVCRLVHVTSTDLSPPTYTTPSGT